MSVNTTYGFNPNKEKVPVLDEEYINNQFQKVIYKDDIVIIHGKLSLNNGAAQHNISYPAGFNKDNCVVLTFMANNIENNHWGYGYIEKSIGYVGGVIGHGVILRENDITVSINNPTDGAHTSGTNTYNYKIVLMKLPTYNLTGMYKGDVNEDGQVTTADANIVNDYTNGDGSLTEKQYRLADINPINGIVDKNDVLKIQSVATGYSEPELFNEENQ